MLNSYLSKEEFNEYIIQQNTYLKNTIKNLDSSWAHSGLIREWCMSALDELKQFSFPLCENEEIIRNYRVERKTAKYTHWVEVMRLAFFQYERFTEKRSAKSEALYSTLSSLACIWGGHDIKKIVIPGCGPGRSVLDFGRMFPDAQILGLDYSLLALTIGCQIVCSDKNVQLLQRDVNGGSQISRVYNVKGFHLPNTHFGIINLATCQIPDCDMIVCSNTLNLLPDHEAAVRNLTRALHSGGIIIFADLIGWRLDRSWENRQLYDDIAIIAMFEKYGMEMLDSFSGVPYMESESDDQTTYYNEHFYVGRKK